MPPPPSWRPFGLVGPDARRVPGQVASAGLPRQAQVRTLAVSRPCAQSPHQLLPRTDAAGRPRAPAPPARQRKSNDSPIYSAPATVVAPASTSPSGAPAGPTHPRVREGPALSSRPRHGSTLVSPPPFTAADKVDTTGTGHGTYVRRQLLTCPPAHRGSPRGASRLRARRDPAVWARAHTLRCAGSLLAANAR